MKMHRVKCWPGPFEAAMTGQKTAEFRPDDRDYKKNDLLIMEEWDPESGRFTGEWGLFLVSDVRRSGHFGIPEGHAMLSVKLFPNDSSDIAELKTSEGRDVLAVRFNAMSRDDQSRFLIRTFLARLLR